MSIKTDNAEPSPGFFMQSGAKSNPQDSYVTHKSLDFEVVLVVFEAVGRLAMVRKGFPQRMQNLSTFSASNCVGNQSEPGERDKSEARRIFRLSLACQGNSFYS
jgi:hypothetical protein